MVGHKFKIGQSVHYTGSFGRGGTCKVLQLLPIENDGEFRYRIKSPDETFERVVKENELERESD